MHTFQTLISKMTEFWAKQGCVIQQGHDVEVGAGTFNPATFLRCLGPEPYSTVYIEPSRRPQDGRYGENPNRLQLFHQLQVILKPSPINVQELYLQSLEAIGIDLKKHDIRFVHDDWESPTLDAWGLGWEVWCDGMEITQFTYFQSIAGLSLHPISVELTIGLERLCMALQNVDHFADIQWNETLTYGDIFLRNEKEWSEYNFTHASTKMWLRHFEDFENEAKTMINLHLSVPAYDFVIKASHAFNLLEARGVLSTTERTGYISRIRDLSRLIANEYIAMRSEQGFPLLKESAEKPLSNLPLCDISSDFDPKKKDDFLLEIGSEELPATFVPTGCKELQRHMERLLKDEQLSYESLAVFGTPRRLSILIKGLSHGAEDQVIEKRGPNLTSAFDGVGNLTKQGAGFLKSIGVNDCHINEIKAKKIPGLEICQIKGNDYLYSTRTQKGKSTTCIFQQALPKLILSLHFPKTMRWSDLEVTYARPLQWLTALLGKQVVSFEIANIISGRTSRGHSQRDNVRFEISHPSEYVSNLKDHFVMVDIDERKASILKQLESIEQELSCQAEKKETVLAQVLHLVEWPELAHQSFDEEYLAAPKEVLISEMVEHQKYFPLAHSDGKLISRFVITVDNAITDEILKGNQKVLSARLADGVFLYNVDLKLPLESFNDKLKEVIFQKKLGSLFDKVEKVTKFAHLVSKHLEIGEKEKISRAAFLCKADLATALVGEFPELQGTIGKHYALSQNEDHEVASAIEEHWLPKSEKGALPSTPTGIVLSLANKFDNLLSYFSIGLKPTSSSDPYALRRQSFGLLKIAIENKFSMDLPKLFEEGLAFSDASDKEVIEEILTFLRSRMKTVLECYGFKKDEIEASLQAKLVDPFDEFCRVKALHDFRKGSENFQKLAEVYKRAKGQVSERAISPLKASLFVAKEEKSLHEQLQSMQKDWAHALEKRDYQKGFTLLSKLQSPLADLFDNVKILADDEKVRENRIALLSKVLSHFTHLLDFEKIQF